MTLTLLPARSFACLLATISLVVGGAVAARAADGNGLPLQSPAPQGRSACLSGQFCLWPQASYTGTVLAVTTTNKVVNITGSHYSVANDSSHAAEFWSGTNQAGSRQCLPPGAQITSTSFSPGSVELLSVTSCWALHPSRP